MVGPLFLFVVLLRPTPCTVTTPRSRGPFFCGKEGRKEFTLGHTVTVTGTVTVTVILGHTRPGSFSRTRTGAFFRWEESKDGRNSLSVTPARVRSPARARGPFLGGKEGRKEITLGHTRPGSFSRTLTGAFFRWEGRKEGIHSWSHPLGFVLPHAHGGLF